MNLIQKNKNWFWMKSESFNELIFFIEIFNDSYKKEFFSDKLTNYIMR